MSLSSAAAAVLLSTWNGAEYLRPQLDSILGQTRSDLILIVRDDGSSDDTLSLLDEYAARDQRVTIHRGRNLGAAGSFMELIRLGQGFAPVLFFADQDDVWATDKVGRMAARIAAFDAARPALYYTAVRLVDAAGQPLARDLPFIRPPRFGEALVQGVAPGCVMAMNAALVDLLADNQPDPRRIVMHDMWAMMAASAFGVVAGDPVKTVDYRQHGRNVIGGQTGLELLRTRIARVLRPKHPGLLAVQAAEFRRVFGDQLSREHRATLDSFIAAATADLPHRLAAARSPRFGRIDRLDDLILRALLVGGLHRAPISEIV